MRSFLSSFRDHQAGCLPKGLKLVAHAPAQVLARCADMIETVDKGLALRFRQADDRLQRPLEHPYQRAVVTLVLKSKLAAETDCPFAVENHQLYKPLGS